MIINYEIQPLLLIIAASLFKYLKAMRQWDVHRENWMGKYDILQKSVYQT